MNIEHDGHISLPEAASYQNDTSVALFLEVNRTDIVFFQAIFESYEGIGTVRTMDQTRGIIAILTTPSMLSALLRALQSLQATSQWRFASYLHSDEKSRYVEELMNNSSDS